MESLNQNFAAEKQEWTKPEVQILSVKEGTLGTDRSGDDGFDAGS